MNFKLLAVYGAFEALLLLSSAVFGRAWFYSSQVAFGGSLLVLAATFRAYKKRVQNGVRDYDASADDDIDEWGENHEEFPNVLLRASESKRGDEPKFSGENDVLKPKNTKRNLAENLRDLKKNLPNFFTAFVPFRLIAYAVLVVGFLALKRQDNLDIAAFLIALAAMPAASFIYGFKSLKGGEKSL